MSGSFHKQNPLNNYYRGPVRQRGSGNGSLALKVARHALPLLSKYVLPSAKRVGKDFASNLLPEVFDVVTGRGGEPATSSSIKKAVKRAAGNTVKKQLGTGAAKRRDDNSQLERVPRPKTDAQPKRGAKKQQQQKRHKDVKRLTFFKTCLDAQPQNNDDGSSGAHNT